MKLPWDRFNKATLEADQTKWLEDYVRVLEDGHKSDYDEHWPHLHDDSSFWTSGRSLGKEFKYRDLLS
jgi:hypothetical protein